MRMMKLRCFYIKNLWDEFSVSLKIVLWSRLNLLFFISSPIIVIGTQLDLLNEASCFILAGIALIPCAERLSLVTEHIAERTNGTIGALLNATFGNAPELLISSAALRSGFYRLVQLTLLGSVLTNLMFVFGLSSLVGGLRWQRQRIRITSGNVLIGMLLVASIGLVLPATLKLAHQSSTPLMNFSYTSSANMTTDLLGYDNITLSVDTTISPSELQFSRINAIIMIGAYILFIIFQLGTHKEEFDYSGEEYAVFGGGHNIVRVPGMQPGAVHYNTHFPSEAQYNIFCLDLGFRSIFSLCDRGIKYSNKAHMTLNSSPPSTDTTTTTTMDTNISITDPPLGEIKCILPSPPNGESLFRRSPSKSKIMYDRLSITSMSEAFPMVESDDEKAPRNSLDSPSSPYDEERIIQDYDRHPIEPVAELEDPPTWMSLRTALLWLWLITIVISSLSDVIVDTIDGFAHRSNLSEVFISVIIIPYFSNIAEQVSAVIFAFRNKMDLCVGVTVGSAAQVALFILPGTVLVGWYFDRPMSLYFRGYETVCCLLSVICVGSVLQGGSTNWMSGLVSVCIYFMIAGGFLYHEDERLSWETHIAHNNSGRI